MPGPVRDGISFADDFEVKKGKFIRSRGSSEPYREMPLHDFSLDEALNYSLMTALRVSALLSNDMILEDSSIRSWRDRLNLRSLLGVISAIPLGGRIEVLQLAGVGTLMMEEVARLHALGGAGWLEGYRFPRAPWESGLDEIVHAFPNPFVPSVGVIDAQGPAKSSDLLIWNGAGAAWGWTDGTFKDLVERSVGSHWVIADVWMTGTNSATWLWTAKGRRCRLESRDELLQSVGKSPLRWYRQTLRVADSDVFRIPPDADVFSELLVGIPRADAATFPVPDGLSEVVMN